MRLERFTRPGDAGSRPPGRVVAVAVTAGLAAIVLGTQLAVTSGAPLPVDLARATLLAALAVAQLEIARRRPGATADLGTVSTFAGALLLPATTLIGLAVVVTVHRAWRIGSTVPRAAARTATVVLACLSAHEALVALGAPDRPPTVHPAGQLAALAALLGTALLYAVVDEALVAAMAPWGTPAADEADMLPVATLALGALTANALLEQPLLVLLALPGLFLLNRAAQVRRLAEAARTDGKTGLLNVATWQEQADLALGRPTRSAVLVVDLDHFKAINDRYGHLAGDQVLAAVAGALRTEVREGDVVGRFGGEEFVVLLTGALADLGEVLAVADRIRTRVSRLRVEIAAEDGTDTVTGLTVSVGAAVSPDHGSELRKLLDVADAALYAAKQAGRNAVRMGGLQIPDPREG